MRRRRQRHNVRRPTHDRERSCQLDNGLTWHFLSRVVVDPSGEGRFTYAGLLPLPDGELHCYCLHLANDQEVEGARNAICMSASGHGAGDDGARLPPSSQVPEAVGRTPLATATSIARPGPCYLMTGAS